VAIMSPTHHQLLVVVRKLALSVHGMPVVALGRGTGRRREGDGVDDGFEL
jgi:hypothetical protein